MRGSGGGGSDADSSRNRQPCVRKYESSKAEERDSVIATDEYQYLEPRPRSNYRQLWIKGRHIRAEVLYRHTVGAEPRTPEEVADDYGLPVDAVREAVEYSVRNKSLLDAERSREESRLCEAGLNQPSRVSDPAGR
ncbi:MAG: hypothetical protein DWQ34_07735 [Planctomycetota bacterium]|nr:MAG: hypothetical protein DWQ34_07735 [Planctomycetota bacterium]REK40024.1 MAG: hypothetical protein DWQ45_00265 [Planctomycetota bacterium]